MVETRGGRRFAVFFFVAAFLVLFLGRWLTPVDHFALTIASPFESLVSSLGSRVGNAASALLGNDTTQAQLDQMRHEVARLLKANVTLQTVEHENALLTRELGYADKNPTLSLFT